MDEMDYDRPKKRKCVFNEEETITQEEKLVYTMGNEIHFTANINKITIQEIIKQMTNYQM